MAEIVPFPINRRRAFVERQAYRAAELNAEASERHIRQQIDVQVAAMRRKGIPEDLITAEARCMESAIRAALWKAVFNGGAK